MQYSKKVYIERGFLKWMCENAADDSHIKYEEKKVCRALYNFLYEAIVEIHLDFSEAEFDSEYKGANKIVKKSAKGNTVCPPYEKIIYKIHDAQYDDQEHIQLYFDHHALAQEMPTVDTGGLYLTMLSSDQCELLINKTGAFIISQSNIGRLEPLTNDSGMPIPKGFESDWSAILKQCEVYTWVRNAPCSFITIIDNYILNDLDLIKVNLMPIIESLLPKQYCSGNFRINIVTMLRGSGQNGKDLSFDCRWHRVKQIIQHINRPYPVELCIIKCGDKTFHDRTILTDNMWIGCGAGFDLFNARGKTSKTTIVNVVSPFINDKINWAFKSYANLLDKVDEVANYDCPDYNVWLEEGRTNIDSYPHFKRKEALPYIG